jgi:hypothetical protein
VPPGRVSSGTATKREYVPDVAEFMWGAVVYVTPSVCVEWH